MQALLVVGFGLALAALWRIGSARFPAGQGPLERLPLGLAAKPTSTGTYDGASGRRYALSMWVEPGGRQFTLAVVKGRPEWISFWQNGSQRVLLESFASAGTLGELRKDWAV